jgi:hypothetical protein
MLLSYAFGAGILSAPFVAILYLGSFPNLVYWVEKRLLVVTLYFPGPGTSKSDYPVNFWCPPSGVTAS